MTHTGEQIFIGKLKHSFSLIPLNFLQTNTCKQDQGMESSEELVFLASGASWVLAFSCRNLGEMLYLERKQERIHSMIFFFGGHVRQVAKVLPLHPTY